MVWPALLPPAHRAQTSDDEARMSTSLPLPSSPHWDPRLEKAQGSKTVGKSVSATRSCPSGRKRAENVHDGDTFLEFCSSQGSAKGRQHSASERPQKNEQSGDHESVRRCAEIIWVRKPREQCTGERRQAVRVRGLSRGAGGRRRKMKKRAVRKKRTRRSQQMSKRNAACGVSDLTDLCS
jgi:hypothetical protein